MTENKKLKKLKKIIPQIVGKMMADPSLMGANAYNGIAKLSWEITTQIEELLNEEG